MFFTILFESMPSVSLRIIVDTDGQLHFHATDIAKILGQQNCSQFVLRNSKTQVKDVMKKELGLKASVLKVWLFDWDEGIELMSNCDRSRKPFMAAGQLSSEMTRIVRISSKSLQFENFKSYGSNTVKIIPKQEDCSCEFLQDFVTEFTAKCLEMYAETAEKIRLDSLVFHTFDKELEHYNLNEPPKTLKMHFGEQLFVYKLE